MAEKLAHPYRILLSCAKDYGESLSTYQKCTLKNLKILQTTIIYLTLETEPRLGMAKFLHMHDGPG